MAHRSPAAPDPVEDLLAGLVELPAGEQARALEALCEAHPGLAGELRSRYRLYLELRDTGAGVPERFGDFALERELGHGGMGVVYLARQRRGDQERRVALKLVRERGMFSPQARDRLRREGAAAFRLDHPGICPVLDVGEVEGTPYVAMRYVEGRSLAEHIEQARSSGTGLELSAETASTDPESATAAATGADRWRGVVALGEQLALALHAAHEAGLIHRDVKPGNVMVTPAGAPVLLDFGLVRDESDEGASLTLTGQALGTPAYMSPEQISPKGRGIDRTTDVYSLGATLFEALALRPPFEARTREELYRRILTEPPPELRRLVPGVPRQLQTVLATALDKDPARRYATAQAFAEDLRRVRHSQPILARPPGLGRRLWLWGQRNRLAAAVLALLVLAQGIIVVLAVRSERRAAEARQARERARADFQWARDAVQELTRTATEHLADVPWMEEVRTALFDKALEFHRRFLAERGDDPELRLDAAVAKRETAALLSQLGDPAQAAGLLDEVANELAGVDGAGQDRGRTFFLAGQVAETQGDLDAAESHYRAAVGQWQAVLDRHPQANPVRADLGQCLRRLSDLLVDRGRLQEAGEAIDRSLLVLAEGGEDIELDLQRAGCLGQRAKMHRDGRRFAEAEKDYGAARELLAAWLQRRPQDRRALLLAANVDNGLGVLLRRLRRAGEARAAYDSAREKYERLVASFPEMLVPRVNLAITLGNLATLTRQSGDPAAARRLLERSVALLEGIVREHDQPDNRRSLALSRYNLGNALRGEDPEAAAQQYRLALDDLEHLISRQPDVPEHLWLAGAAARNLGTVLAVGGRDEEAAAMLARGGGYTRELVRRHPERIRYRRELGLQLFNEGAHLAEIGRLPDAAERLREALDLRRELVAASPQDPRALSDLLKTWVRRAHVAEVAADPEWTSIWAAAGRELAAVPRELRATLEGNLAAAFDIACIEHGLAAAQLAAGRPDPQTGERLLQAHESLEEWHRRSPGAAVVAVEQLLCCWHRAVLHRLAGEDEDAAQARARTRAAAEGLDVQALGSRLQRARLTRHLPALLAELRRGGEDLAAVEALQKALAR